MTQLILKAASQGLTTLPRPTVVVDCDNKGVVLHGNSAARALKEKQPQADVLRVFKQLILGQPFNVVMTWVPSHQDDQKSWGSCTLKERMNIKVDRLAKLALISGVAEQRFIHSVFPDELIRVTTGGIKVTGSLKKSFERHWGYKEGQALFHHASIVNSADFHLIWWDGVERAMSAYPKRFRMWVTKQVSGCCGSNHEIARWDETVVDECPNCGCSPETSKHMTRCQHDGRMELFRLSSETVLACLVEAHADPELVDLVDEYMTAQGERSMFDCLQSAHSKFAVLASVQDRLGWDSFVEGRISKMWLDTMAPFFAQSGIKSADKWGVRFVGCLISITHKQWIFRNSKVHHKSEGLTQKQHDKLFAKVRELMCTEPSTLLPKHRSLLTENFGLLGAGPTKMRRGWVASMESALKAAARVRAGTAVSPETALLGGNQPSRNRFSRRPRRQKPVQRIPPTPTTQSPPPPLSLSERLARLRRTRAAQSTHCQANKRMQIRRRDRGSCLYKKDWRVK